MTRRRDGYLTPPTVEERTTEIATVHAKYWAKPKPKPRSNGSDPTATRSNLTPLTDAELLDRARAATFGERFARLYDHGDLGDHDDDHSAADLALCGYLARLTDDPEQVDRVFRDSQLMRPKWDSKRNASTYGWQTVEKAIRERGAFEPAPLGRDPTDHGPTEADVPPDLLDTAPAPQAPPSRQRPKLHAVKPNRPQVAPLVTLGELYERRFEPVEAVIEDAVVPGLNILAGKPKLGKSWLALRMALSVATGDTLWNRQTKQGRAIYYGLEDSLRRLQARLRKLGPEAATATAADALHLGTELPRLDAGGLEHLREVLTRYPDTRLVVLDTLARVKPTNPAKGTAYDADSALGADLQGIAKEHDVALLVVTHLRKMAAEDALDTVSGSLGLVGAADAVLILQRKRGEADATLTVSGRDLEEREDALRFDPETGLWHLLGSAADYAQSKQRRLILDAVRDLQAVAGANTGPSAVADHLGDAVKANIVRQLMPRMARDGALAVRGRGQYYDPAHPVAGGVANVAPVAFGKPYRED